MDFEKRNLVCTQNFTRHRTPSRLQVPLRFRCGEFEFHMSNMAHTVDIVKSCLLAPVEFLHTVLYPPIPGVCSASFPGSAHVAFDSRVSVIVFYLTLVPIKCQSPMVSWSQICLLDYIAVFETVRSYELKKCTTPQRRIRWSHVAYIRVEFVACNGYFEHVFCPVIT